MINRIDKEATLRDVLSEVSLLDAGRLLKGAFQGIGCYLILLVMILGSAWISDVSGFRLSNLGLPTWPFWLLFTWVIVAGATTERSFHELNWSWYFPKLGWFSSLLLSAYVFGLIQLLISLGPLEKGIERALAFGAIWIGYAGPFLLFLAIVNVGYSKLMEKRESASRPDATRSDPDESWRRDWTEDDDTFESDQSY